MFVSLQALLQEMDGKEEQMKSVCSSGEALVQCHDQSHDVLQQELAQLAAKRGLSVAQLYSKHLDVETSVGVKRLEGNLKDIQELWDNLRKKLLSRLSEVDVALVASQDLSEAVAGQRQSIEQFRHKVCELHKISADREELKRQREDQKVILECVIAIVIFTFNKNCRW